MSDSEAIPAATLVVIRDSASGPPELVMVERPASMAFAGGMMVFPGGRIDPGDWREGGDLLETLHRLDSAGCARFVVTDVSADGMLRGPNLDLLRRVCDETGKPVVASGGISTLEDILALREMVGIGVEGAIIGTALYVGRFTIEEALVAAQLDSTTGSNDT